VGASALSKRDSVCGKGEFSMRRTELYVVLGTLGVAAVVAVVGCGGMGSSLGNLGGPPVRSLQIPDTWLEPVSDLGQTLRWLDIGDHQYANTFISGFGYPSNTVQLSGTDGDSLAFALSAGNHALKPNFCYQMKLEGPASRWGSDPNSDFVNGEFGYNGRWWCDTCNASLTDTTVSSHMRRRHVVKGYLYFDFFVTDETGKPVERDAAGKPLIGSNSYTGAVVNSYHVTWKTTQRTPGANDGPIRDFNVVAVPDGWAYDQDYTGASGETVSLYGEWEPNRPLPGALQLAPGTYGQVQFRLTEESFHASGIGGNWATVMAADGISFQVTGSGDDPPSVVWANPLDGVTVDGSVGLRINAQDAEDPAGSLTVEWNVDGGAWQTAGYNSSTGYYEATWDTTSVSNGSHALNARATDSASNQATDGIGVTVNNSSAPVVVTSISPPSMQKGTTSPVTINGSGFMAGAQVTFEGGKGAPPTASVSSATGTEIAGTVTVKVNAKPNTAWDVRVTNPDSSSGVLAGGFTVLP